MRHTPSAVQAQNELIRHRAEGRIQHAATIPLMDAMSWVGSNLGGLDRDEVAHSEADNGRNVVTRGKKKSLVRKLADAFVNPFTAILFFLAIISATTDMIFPALSMMGNTPEDFDPLTVIIITTMVVLSGTLRYVQEARSGNAAEKLLDMITTTVTVTRKDVPRTEIPIDDVVVGDIVHLSAGDMIPADVRIIEAKDLFVGQASLTGESEPVEKVPTTCTESDSATSFENIALMGSSVISGSATALVFSVGEQTLFGSMASSLSDDAAETSFSKGVNSVSWVLIRFMMVMVPFVFLINGVTKGNWLDAGLFAISIAVGLTPEMLPMIVTTCLAKGAVAMSKKQTIVKNLNSIQNFGAMDVLCTDKTGTLTQDQVVLEYHWNIDGQEDSRVLRHAYLNSYFQTGYKNLMDLAIIKCTEEEEQNDPSLTDLSEAYVKVDEVPFDFTRRRLTTVVRDRSGKTQMVTKGAAEEMLEICSFVEIDGIAQPLTDEKLAQIRKQIAGLNAEGLRVIAVAQKTNPRCVGEFGIADECDMVLMGFLAFLDPPKASAAGAVATLEAKGVAVKVLTGDNDRVAATVCEQIGIDASNVLLGSEIDALDDAELAERAEKTHLFTKLSPLQKARLVRVMREMLGHTVGFMGDGINDAAAMRASDCGISVDSAVDIAKESADIILLQKDLGVLERGIIEGRRTYGNLLKYLKTTVSSNFGNVLSVTVASLFLPFLPMSALQLVLLSLVYEIVCIALPWDTVDDAWTARPRAWDAASIKGFMLELGPVSSLFDIVTFAALFFVVCPAAVDASWSELAAAGDVAGMATFAALFQSGWFVESMWSQTLVVHMLRSPHLPSPRDHAAPTLCVLTVLGLALVTWLPASPIADALGLMPLPTSFFALLIGIVSAYIALTQLAKRRYIARHGELL